MSTMTQTAALETDDRLVLAYMHHMAQTAQQPAAKRLYELFVQQENRRIEGRTLNSERR